MEHDPTFTRRICAVLLADVSGFSALMGEDDERTARAVQHLQTLVHGIITDAKGSAETAAGDAIFATFDSVVAAVEAAVTIQRRIAAESFAGRRLQIRIGVHSGDVLLRPGAGLSGAVGDAINVAARLQALAKPGTICISEGVYRQVRNKFDEQFVDLGRQRLKNISDSVHAYLVVPRELGPTRRNRRSALLWGGSAALVVALGIAAVALSQHYRRAPATKAKSVLGEKSAPELAANVGETTTESGPESGQVALGVMLFRGMGADAQNDWRRDALRDGLNTQLSGLSRVKVYSKEFIDFLITRKGLTEIEAASQLGIKKMLSGSFVELGDTLRIETHIVDVGSGVMEASYTTSGSGKDFLDLQNKLALGVISRLNLPVTEQEKKTLIAQQQNTNVDALKLLLEAEGGAAAASEPRSESSVPTASLARGSFPALQPWTIAAVALADETGGEAPIKDVLEQYRRATESKELAALAALYAAFTPEQQAAQQKYFENVRELHVSIDHVDVAVVGDEAVASYTRTDDFVDARTGRPMHVAVRLTKTLRKQEGAWKLAGK